MQASPSKKRQDKLAQSRPPLLPSYPSPRVWLGVLRGSATACFFWLAFLLLKAGRDVRGGSLHLALQETVLGHLHHRLAAARAFLQLFFHGTICSPIARPEGIYLDSVESSEEERPCEQTGSHLGAIPFLGGESFFNDGGGWCPVYLDYLSTVYLSWDVLRGIRLKSKGNNTAY